MATATVDLADESITGNFPYIATSGIAIRKLTGNFDEPLASVLSKCM